MATLIVISALSTFAVSTGLVFGRLSHTWLDKLAYKVQDSRRRKAILMISSVWKETVEEVGWALLPWNAKVNLMWQKLLNRFGSALKLLSAILCLFPTYKLLQLACWYFKIDVRYYLSLYLYQPRPTDQRQQFRNTPVTPSRVPPNHTHGKEAANRATAYNFVTQLADELNLTVYDYQSDGRHFKEGSRSYHTFKDLKIEPKPWPAELPEDALVSVFDVDYYLDMFSFLNTNSFRPVVLYTIIPDVASHANSEASHMFKEDGKLHMKVSGGAEYDHEIWNWAHDVLHVSTFGTLSVYETEKKKISSNRYVVFLQPINRYNGLRSLVASYFLTGKTLERLNPITKASENFVVMNVQTAQGLYVSIALPNSYICATVPRVKLEMLLASQRNSPSVPMNTHTVQGSLPDATRDECVLLARYVQCMCPLPSLTVYPVEHSINYYQHTTLDKYIPDAKHTMVPIASPLMLGVSAPDATEANDVAAARERLLNPQRKSAETEKDYTYHKPLVSFFIDKMAEYVPDLVGKCVPVDVDQVIENQPRPSQRNIIKAALAENDPEPRNNIDNFQKQEPYPAPKPPRIISQFAKKPKVETSQLAYGLAPVIKRMPWYAFGLTPVNVAKRVSSICQAADEVAEADATRLDGHVGLTARMLERTFVKKFVHADYIEMALRILEHMFGQKSTSAFRVKVMTGLARLSGDPFTSMFNTLLTAYISFLGYYYQFGNKETAWEAVMKNGMYGGDDSLAGDQDAEPLIRAARDCGVPYKVDIKDKLSPVTFLARVYNPNVWNGCLDSMCDFKRQMSKIHTTTPSNKQKDPFEVLMMKCVGYWMSDRNTPYLSQLCQRVFEIARFDYKSDFQLRAVFSTDFCQSLMSWSTKHDFGEQYPNENVDNWMQQFIMHQIPDWAGTTFLEHLEKSHTRESLLKFPLCSNMAIAVGPGFVGTHCNTSEKTSSSLAEQIKELYILSRQHDAKAQQLYKAAKKEADDKHAAETRREKRADQNGKDPKSPQPQAPNLPVPTPAQQPVLQIPDGYVMVPKRDDRKAESSPKIKQDPVKNPGQKPVTTSNAASEKPQKPMSDKDKQPRPDKADLKDRKENAKTTAEHGQSKS